MSYRWKFSFDYVHLTYFPLCLVYTFKESRRKTARINTQEVSTMSISYNNKYAVELIPKVSRALVFEFSRPFGVGGGGGWGPLISGEGDLY